MLRKLKLGKLDWYIIKKFMSTYFLSIALIISIAVVFDVAEKIDDFMETDPTFYEIVFQYYLNFMPYYANLFSFLFVFLAVIFFTSKMAGQTEIVAMLSAGISFRRILYPYFVGAAILTVFSLVLSNYVIPISNFYRLEFENTYINTHHYFKERNAHRQIEPGVYAYVESYNIRNNTGYKFSLEKFEGKQLKSKLISDYFRWDSTKTQWTVYNYYIREIHPDKEIITQGKSMDTTLNLFPQDFHRRLNDVETMNTPELNQFIEDQTLRGDTNLEVYYLEKYKRIAFPFSTFIMTLLGASVASRKSRRGTGMHMGIGIMLTFGYILFMQVSSQFAISGGLNPLLAIWIPNILFLIIAIFIYKTTPK